MWACNYGVAVSEDIDERDFNSNIALEYGFMMALGKRVLLLKEQRMPRVPTDITGKLWKPFSIFDVHTTITQQIDAWAKDIGLIHIGTDNLAYIPPVSLASMVKQALIHEVETHKYKEVKRLKETRDGADRG